MKISESLKGAMNLDREGISPVVGSILLIAISVIIAGTIGYFVVSQSIPEPMPTTALSFESVNDGDNRFYITKKGGDPIKNATKNLELYVQGSKLEGNVVNITGGDNDLNAGESLEVKVDDFSRRGRIKAIHAPSNSILAESKSKLHKTTDDGAESPDITEEGADLSAYQPPNHCDITVDDSWDADEVSDQAEKFKTISAAINNASSGEVIGVKKGTYNENHINVNESVTIASLDGPDETSIDAGGDQHVFWVTSDLVDIRGFKMVNYTKHGVDFQDGSDSRVSGNIFDSGMLALSAVQAFSNVENVEIFNNVMRGIGVRGYTGTCSRWNVNNNTIDVQNENHHGIVGGGPNWTISHNDIRNCGNPSEDGYHQAIDTYQYGNASDWTIENNNIHDSEDGIEIEGAGHVANYNNIYNIENLAVGCDKEMDATKNWWGTTENSEIEAMINEKIDYYPFLDEPR